MAEQKIYHEAVGRRKTAIARVRLSPTSATSVTVNGNAVEVYFKTPTLQSHVFDALKGEPEKHFSISAQVHGGGQSAQSEAIRHGIARALIKFDESLRKKLKDAGYLKRDPRVKERRKFGLKKARKAPQWAKR